MIRKGSKTSPQAENDFISRATADAPEKGRGEKKSQAFSLMIPMPLYIRLQNYVEDLEQMEGIRPSLASVMVRALKRDLDEAEAKTAKRGK